MKNNLGMATVGSVTIKADVLNSDVFLSGKAGDSVAANTIIEKIWQEKKTDQLKEHLTRESVFLTMPSTTRSNVIPLQLAIYLSHKTNTPWLNGDYVFDVEHQKASKNIPRDKRVFSRRLFTIQKRESVFELQNKNVVIVDDIITTGSSIRNLSEVLFENKISVSHVVGLMGDRRLEIDKKTEEKLKKALEQLQEPIDFNKIDYITRTEAGGILRLLNNARSQNAIRKLTHDLQGIQRFGITKDIKGTPRTGGHKSPSGNDKGNVRVGERIPNYTGASNTEWVIEFKKGGQTIESVQIGINISLDRSEKLEELSSIARKLVSKKNLGAIQVRFKEINKIKKENEKTKEQGQDQIER